MVTLSMGILQTICSEMEDDEPVSFDVWNTQVAPVPFLFFVTFF
ncbi:unnamed protein product [Brugia timori]|uniref:Uncharacterized protein n=1 Tax=Brugia timori TaxID=42155 RepID=A0A0R3QY61_9BILA|nr:unnamed protein product [Brugia timori]